MDLKTISLALGVIGVVFTGVWAGDKYYAKAAELESLAYIVAANETNAAFRDKSREVESLRLLLEADPENAALRLRLRDAETDLSILRAQLLESIKKK